MTSAAAATLINDELAVLIVAFLLSVEDYTFLMSLAQSSVDNHVFRVCQAGFWMQYNNFVVWHTAGIVRHGQ